jgi:hypothetical protein
VNADIRRCTSLASGGYHAGYHNFTGVESMMDLGPIIAVRGRRRLHRGAKQLDALSLQPSSVPYVIPARRSDAQVDESRRSLSGSVSAAGPRS